VVDWNWNTGTGPTTTLTFHAAGPADWAVGAATNGPKDGLTYLATAPGKSYPDNANDWVRLPMIDLSAHLTCNFRITVDLWRSAEQFGIVDYDGGNLQYTIDPTGSTGWKAVDGSGMMYDGQLPDCTAPCLVDNQNTWTSSANPKSKTAVYTSATPPGGTLWLRFTFDSDGGNVNGALPGIFVSHVLVEAY
jgi:hypothetical protein